MNADPVTLGSTGLTGELFVPDHARGVVVFAHGSGSSRNSPRNRFVAGVLQRRRLGTLLLDLLTDAESAEGVDKFDVDLLARRLSQAVAWLRERPGLADARIGLFGASTGAAAALTAAAEHPEDVHAVVSRGGRPDLAAHVLDRVRAPTLLIVGSSDPEVFELNREAYQALSCEKRLEVVPRATHLFEEAGAMEHVAAVAGVWFTDHMLPPPSDGAPSNR